MSRQNKVNPDHYTGAGRLSPDDWARERRKQSESMFGSRRGSNKKPMAPWMVSDSGSGHPESADVAREDTADSVEGSEQATGEPDDANVGAQAPQAKPRPRATAKQAAKAAGSRRAQQRTTVQKKTAGRKSAAGAQTTTTRRTRGVASRPAKPRSKMKASGASGTPKSGKATRARATSKKGTAKKATAKAKKR